LLAVTRIASQERRGIKGTRERGLDGEKAIVFGVLDQRAAGFH
jgi:hypothetical protein